MKKINILRRMVRSKVALKETIQKILELNRRLKAMRESRFAVEKAAVKQELKLLNKMADQQAKIIQLYQTIYGDSATNKTRE